MREIKCNTGLVCINFKFQLIGVIRNIYFNIAPYTNVTYFKICKSLNY